MSEFPTTLEGKQLAIGKQVRIAFDQFKKKSDSVRYWDSDDMPYREVSQQGSKLSENTVDLLEGFMGIELQNPNFEASALESFGKSRYFRPVVLRWSEEEKNHGVTLERTLACSGRRTPDQIEDYKAHLLEKPWSPNLHPGMNDPRGVIVYTTFQERGTYLGYQRLRTLFRTEVGLPNIMTGSEAQAKKEEGISEILRKIGTDEIAHHGLFLQILAIELAYFPDEIAEKIDVVKNGFRMPAVSLLPRRAEFLRAVANTGLDSRKMQESEVFQPTLKALGLAA